MYYYDDPERKGATKELGSKPSLLHADVQIRGTNEAGVYIQRYSI
jgi:hypothetical protein